MGDSSAARVRQAVWTALVIRQTTQAELARRCKLSPKHVNQTLHGHAGLGLDLADRMLAALGCELVVGVHVPTGSSVGRTVYDPHGRLVGLLDTPEQAQTAVDAMNADTGSETA